MDPRYAQILTREFAQAGGFDPEDIQVEFNEDNELIKVYVSGSGLWVMQIGSDDDGFWFNPAENWYAEEGSEFDGFTQSEGMIEFDFPPDWLALEESQFSPRDFV